MGGGREAIGGPSEIAGIERKDDDAVAARRGLRRAIVNGLLGLLGGGVLAAGRGVEHDVVLAQAEAESREAQRDEGDHRERKAGGREFAEH